MASALYLYPRMKKFLLSAAVLATALFTACDDTTEAAGFEVMPHGDDIATSTAVFSAPTSTVESGSVLVATQRCYLGCMVDPTTGVRTRAGFLAQFRPIDDYAQPERSLIVEDENGLPACDSCDLRMYFISYYGDSLASMNVRVRELSRTRIMEEGQEYYSDITPADYLDDASRVDLSAAYSIIDPAKKNASANSMYYRSVSVRLPAAYGAEIIRAYYDNPTAFKTPYGFVHNVCPGLYVENTGGVGSMLNVEFSTLDIYYSYRGVKSDGTDTVYTGVSRMAATEEVLQNTCVETTLPETLLDPSNPYTLLLSPAGSNTVMDIPVDDILGGEHATDTLNSAQLILSRYAGLDGTENPFALQPPAHLLLVAESEREAFFLERKLPDGETSMLAAYNNGAYSFDNVALLIKHLQAVRLEAAGVVDTDTEPMRAQKLTVYDAANPRWNRVAIVPVDAEYTSVSTLAATSKILTRVRNALSLTAVALSGGTGGAAPQLRCVYSHFE